MRVGREEEEKGRETYHDRQHGVDFPDVVLILVEDVDTNARLLAAQTAHAARFEGLHTARFLAAIPLAVGWRGREVNSVVAALARHETSHARAFAPTYVRSFALSVCSLLRFYLRVALVCVRALPARIPKSPRSRME